MTTVRAKFKCTSVSEVAASPSSLYEARFEPVTGGSEENKSFWKYTPSGQLHMGGLQSRLFEAGKEYYLDFTPADASAERSAE